MTDTTLAGRTEWEARQYAADCGKHAAKAQAFIRLGLILECDDDAPAPIFMTHRIISGKVTEELRGYAALPSAGDDAGCAAVDRFAARHHVPAGWDDGHYCAVIHLGGGYRYGAFFTPERNLHPAAPVTGEDAPVLAGRAA